MNYRNYRKDKAEILKKAQAQAARPEGENWKDLETIWAVANDVERDCDGGNALDQAYGVIQTMSSQALAAAARGELDLNLLARAQLGNRGADHRGEWVGFDKAKDIARTEFYMSDGKGGTKKITVPGKVNHG